MSKKKEAFPLKPWVKKQESKCPADGEVPAVNSLFSVLGDYAAYLVANNECDKYYDHEEALERYGKEVIADYFGDEPTEDDLEEIRAGYKLSESFLDCKFRWEGFGTREEADLVMVMPLCCFGGPTVRLLLGDGDFDIAYSWQTSGKVSATWLAAKAGLPENIIYDALQWIYNHFESYAC